MQCVGASTLIFEFKRHQLHPRTDVHRFRAVPRSAFKRRFGGLQRQLPLRTDVHRFRSVPPNSRSSGWHRHYALQIEPES